MPGIDFALPQDMVDFFTRLLHVIATVIARLPELSVLLPAKLMHPVRSIFHDPLVILIACVALFASVIASIKAGRLRADLLQARLRRAIFR